jgi:hypothetical protein
MTNKHHQRADKIVAEFKDIIGESVCNQISETHFQDLTLLIRDSISDELLAAAELVEKVARKLRSESDLHELEL